MSLPRSLHIQGDKLRIFRQQMIQFAFDIISYPSTITYTRYYTKLIFNLISEPLLVFKDKRRTSV